MLSKIKIQNFYIRNTGLLQKNLLKVMKFQNGGKIRMVDLVHKNYKLSRTVEKKTQFLYEIL
jgi:hypothetical protein